ncbi:putative tetratricopeptide-like helical domain superfamily, acetyltransferase A, auxiliary subunit [Helianthus annuus]|nr:putative tetratricopeptide-like helical domain superfamily [Helianthus annuus]KAJ0447998.1 putative tetratricopeptide-like helical domain superfamily [Helianthus annuus]KAJ0632891.1 putative tetratricopeptide-like helical domain superfamily [Helianthus annuus]KAJ0813708.1 putative tetratricopeptide-like helical domain superfamily, acetyltransferase A, auxiliary subunit [Helianthus annuus]
MWINKDPPRGFPFSTPQPEKNRTYSSPPYAHRPRPPPVTEKKWTAALSNPSNHLFHIIHKVPAGDSPYVRAKHVQLVENNPTKAVSLFWAAINSGDRIDSALKDMAVVMKQLNRSDEAIEAIKSFRYLCEWESQESLDNILLELFKRSGRIDEQIELLQSKIAYMEENTLIDGNHTKIARSQGKKIQITVLQEYSRLLGNLAWAYLQQDHYKVAEETYRWALSLEPDKNKRCNLAICLMYMNKMAEAKVLLSTVKESKRVRDTDEESYAKSYERAMLVMDELEKRDKCQPGNELSFSSFLTRNKETDTFDTSSKQRCDSDPGYKKSTVSPSPVNGTPRVPFTQPRRREWERMDTGVGCLKKLSFDKPAEGKMEPPGRCSEMSVIPLREEIKKKKSWADMVEEDERTMLESGERSCYGDENVDCNLMNGESGSFRVQDGYQSQPGTATCNRTVKRSLTFGRSQNDVEG